MANKQRCGMAYTGRLLGRHHTTVMHGVRAITNRMRDRDPDALRAYRIAVRCFVQRSRLEAQDRAALKRSIEGASHAL